MNNTKIKGSIRTGICERDEVVVIDEIDILIIHKFYGLLLFEVKDMREVTKISEENVQKTFKLQSSKSNSRCPLEMIAKAEQQLTGGCKNGEMKTSRWNQIRTYLYDFFSDDQVKLKWQKYWNMDYNDIEEMLHQILEEQYMRSFICLFYWDQSKEDEIGSRTFHCTRKNCDCSKIYRIPTAKCNVLTSDVLKSFESFQVWWQEYFTQIYFKKIRVFQLPSYEFLLNRYLYNVFSVIIHS